MRRLRALGLSAKARVDLANDIVLSFSLESNTLSHRKHAVPKTLFVGNLPYSMTEDSLETLFEIAGTVASVRIVLDRQKQRPKGFAFVEFEAPDAADAAIAERRMGGRDLIVNEAQPREFSRGAR